MGNHAYGLLLSLAVHLLCVFMLQPASALNAADEKKADDKKAIDSKVPSGASVLGYTKCVINESPTAADIAPGNNGNHKWFSGQWWMKPPPLDRYSTQNDVLVLSLGGDLVSTPRDFSIGKLPLLPGADGCHTALSSLRFCS